MYLDFRWNEDAVVAALVEAGMAVMRGAAQNVLTLAAADAPYPALAASGRVEEDTAAMRVSVVFSDPGAAAVEFGHVTPSGAWVPPRPFLGRALSEAAGQGGPR